MPKANRLAKVFFDVMSTLDGFVTPDGMDMAHWDDPGYKNWMGKWNELTSWIFKQKFFRANLKLGEGGETGQDNQILEETFKRTGVSVMGKRMFDAGERSWPEEAPFHTSVYVVTNQVRTPWERPGGTTFYFVNDGIESALSQSRKAAGGRDVRIAGGANVIQQFLNAGLVDEFTVHYTPIFFGQGTPLFSGMRNDIRMKVKQVLPSAEVTHIMYMVEK